MGKGPRFPNPGLGKSPIVHPPPNPKAPFWMHIAKLVFVPGDMFCQSGSMQNVRKINRICCKWFFEKDLWIGKRFGTGVACYVSSDMINPP